MNAPILIHPAMFKNGRDALDLAAAIAARTGYVLTAGRSALTLRPPRSRTERASVVLLQRQLGLEPCAA